jgi:hypothetical protein
MEFIDKILDLPVIVQGALGSFLFWLVFIIVQKAFSLLFNFIGNHNKSFQKENILFEQMLLIQSILPVDDLKGIRAVLGSISSGFYKFIKGFIFLCFGFITSEIVGQFAIIPYCFALYYFFRALKACTFETFSNGQTKEEKQKAFDELKSEFDKLQ